MRSDGSIVVCVRASSSAAACARPAFAKSYSADRFDSTVRVLPDGTLEVTETVVFRFQDGTFREVFREIPTRRTDGIEVVRAEMQGEPLPFGTEIGYCRRCSSLEADACAWSGVSAQSKT